MHIINKSLADITLSDVQRLIDEQVVEGKHIDFKREAYGNSDSDKKEFLKDISSFANAGGGDIILGIEEDKGTGQAKKICPLLINPDEEIRRLQGSANTGLDPRLPSLDFKELKINDGYVLVIRIRKSWLSPHRVSFKDSSKFYSRTSKGAELLDTQSLRNAFTLTQTVSDRIRDFRNERMIALSANQTPLPFQDGAKVILHIVPVNSFNTGQRYNILQVYDTPNLLRLISQLPQYRRINLDGVLWSGNANKPECSDYAQIYHNGIIEVVSHSELMPYEIKGKIEYSIAGRVLENKLFNCIRENLKIYSMLDIEPPACILLSLLGVKDYFLHNGETYQYYHPTPLDRDALILPDILIEDYSDLVEQQMRPVIDQLWNAFNYKGSVSYDQDGKWHP